jgi:hypothetical protein
MGNFAARLPAVGQMNCTVFLVMFVNEFFFSFSLLAFSAVLLILGAVITGDGIRRLFRQWSDSTAKKKGNVVLLVDVARPIADRIGNRPHNLVERPIAIPDEKVS